MKYLRMKWLDVVLIVLLVLISFLPNAVFAYQDIQKSGETEEKHLIIKVDGVETERILLDPAADPYEYAVSSGTGHVNTLEISGDTVKMIEANCPDQICVRSFPAISNDGEQIICLPYKLVVQIQGGEKPQGDLNAF